jgi:hypothetical protein
LPPARNSTAEVVRKLLVNAVLVQVHRKADVRFRVLIREQRIKIGMPCVQSLTSQILRSVRFPIASRFFAALFEDVMPEFAMGSGCAQFVVAIGIRNLRFGYRRVMKAYLLKESLERLWTYRYVLGPVCCGSQIVWQALRCRRGCLGNIYDSDGFDNRAKNKAASSLVIPT